MKKLLRLFGIFILLLVSAHVVLNLLWGMQLRNTIRDLKAQGKLKSWDEIKPPPIPDSENACIIYDKIAMVIEHSTSLTRTKRGNAVTPIYRLLPGGKTRLSAEEMQKLSQILQSQDFIRIYGYANEALKKPYCNFNIPYGNPWLSGPLYQPYVMMRYVVKILSAKALLESQSGQPDRALDTLLTGLKISNHLSQEPSFGAQMVRMACDYMLINVLENMEDFSHASPEDIKPIADELSRHDDVSPMLNAYFTILASYYGFFDAVAQGKVSMKSMFMSEGRVPWKESLYSSFAGTPFRRKDAQTLLTLFSQVQDKYKYPYYKVAIDIEKNIKTEKFPWYCILTRLLANQERSTFIRTFHHQAKVEIARAGLALKLYKNKHGFYPTTLDVLSPKILYAIPDDPFSGNSFMYKKSGNGFLLYSLGPNMKDDDGAPLEDTALSMDTKGDIVWKSEN